jgi:hypothetical protein
MGTFFRGKFAPREDFGVDTNWVIWAFGFPILLCLLGAASGTVFAMTDSDSAGFIIVKTCLIFAAFDVVAMSIYWALATRQGLPWNLVVPGIAALIAVPLLVLSLQWVSYREAWLSTQLFPNDLPDPPLPPQIKQVPNNALKIFFGSNLAWATRMPHTLFRMAGESMLEIDRSKSGKQLSIVTLKIFDDRNDIIARIDEEDGFWTANTVRRKRPDPSTLVVYDHSDNEVLHLVFMNPSTLYVTGIFRRPGIRRPLVITPEFTDTGVIRFVGSSFGENGTDIDIGR